MRKEIKVLIGLAAVVLIVTFAATRFYKGEEPQATQVNQPAAEETPGLYGITLREEFVRDDSHTKGPKNAKVTLVEFLDPECEACKAFHPIMKQILQDYEGGIHFVVRYMAFHTSSAMAIAATESAGLQGKYWEMQDLLFNAAEEWGHKSSPDASYFIKYASDLGLNVEQFKKDLNDPRWQQKIARDMADGKVLGVNGTPTIFVNGEPLKQLSPEALRSAIESHLSGP